MNNFFLLQDMGTAIPCIATQLIERMKETTESEDDEVVARNVTAVAYAGKSVVLDMGPCTEVFHSRWGRYGKC